MAFEKKWAAVPSQLFTADGTQFGLVTIPSTHGFKVKAKATLSATSLPQIEVEIKRVLSSTQMMVGLVGQNINNRLNITAYTVAIGSSIAQPEQEKTKVPENDRNEAAYEQEPTVAYRNVLVDEFGNFYNGANPLPFTFDGTIAVGDVQVIGPNGNSLQPNSDGSLNVVVENSSQSISTTVINRWNQATSVPVGATTTINTYTVPTGQNGWLQRVSTSGENIGRYDVLINGNIVDTKRTWWGQFNTDFNFMTDNPNMGYPLNQNDVVTVSIVHNGQVSADFDSRIQITTQPIQS